MTGGRTIYLDGGFAYQTTAPERGLPVGTEDVTLVPMSTSYHPATDGKGKYHVPNPITGTAACGAPVQLDTSPLSALTYGAGEHPHPICCKRCSPKETR